MERWIQRANKPLRLDQRKQCKRASPRILRPSVSRTFPLVYPGDLQPRVGHTRRYRYDGIRQVAWCWDGSSEWNAPRIHSKRQEYKERNEEREWELVEEFGKWKQQSDYSQKSIYIQFLRLRLSCPPFHFRRIPFSNCFLPQHLSIPTLIPIATAIALVVAHCCMHLCCIRQWQWVSCIWAAVSEFLDSCCSQQLRNFDLRPIPPQKTLFFAFGFHGCGSTFAFLNGTMGIRVSPKILGFILILTYI